MLKIIKPSPNRITQGYSNTHKGYDFSGRGDKNAYCVVYGKVVQSKNSETRNWQAFKNSDPYKKTRNGKLITEDYGNYCKIRGEIEGKNYYFLYAHLEAGSVLPVGSEVKVGQVIGQIGNTGNSTAPHLHFEVRDENNNNIPVEFVDDMPKNQELVSKEQIIIDAYKAETGEFPTDDEKKWRLQQNLNTIQLIESLHQDSRFYEKWVKPNIPDKDISWHETALLYQESFEKIKELLGAAPAENTEEVIGRIKKLIERNKELEKLQEPKTIYKYENKDYVPLIRLSNIIVAIQKET